MIALESMIVSMSLSWMKRVFSDCRGTWKRYFIHDLECFGGLFYIRNYFESGVGYMIDFQFHVNNEESFKFYQKQST